jgi:hypothetical protein
MRSSNSTKALVGVLGAGFILLAICACNRTQSTITDLIPADSCAVVVIDWTEVRTDQDLKRLVKADQLENVLSELAIDGGSVKNVAIFSAIDSRAKSGVLVRASFDKGRVISSLKTRGWSEQTIEGHKVYAHGNDYVALLQPQTLFVGTREAAASVLRAVDGSREGFATSRSYKKINAGMTTGNAPIKAFLLIPQGTLDMADAALEATSLALSLFDLGGVGALLKQMNIASGFGVTFGHGVNEMHPVEMCVLMRDEKAAALISGSLNLMKSFSAMAANNQTDQQALQGLRDLSVSRMKEVLSIKMTVPRGVLLGPNRR